MTVQARWKARVTAALSVHSDAVDILSDAETLEYYSHDIAGAGERAVALVLKPRTITALQCIVETAHEEKFALYPRGSGLSYTGGYTGGTLEGAALDLTAMNVVEGIDETNRCMTVEAGGTWEQLHRTLADTGWRTPFAGPLSGYESTVGGALSNDAAFFGSARHGSSRGSVLGLTIVLADGSVLVTGTHRFEPHPHPIGPDLTPLFLGDGGALGIKAAATLALVPRGEETRFASFAFETLPSMLSAQSALIDHPFLMESFGFDRQAHENLARGGFTALESAEMLRDIARSESRLSRRFTRVISAAARGQRLVADLECSLHLAFEAPNAAYADAALEDAAALASRHGGTLVPDTIPRVTHTRPFRPIKALLGPSGERWLPMHGIFRPSDVARGWQAVEAFRTANAEQMARHEITTSALTVTSGRSLLLEVHFFWPDALGPFHRRRVSSEQLRAHGGARENLPARALAHELRGSLARDFSEAGATHFQTGRFYEPERPPEAERVLRALKSALDPGQVFNPGVGNLP